MKKRLMQSVTKDINTIALLAAFCIFLSTIEYLIPKPLPFIRLGLANLPIIVSLTIFPPVNVLFLILLKVLGQGLINGTLFSYVFLFSCAGSFSSGLVMILFRTLLKERITLVGISVLGSLGSNLVQIYLSKVLIFGEGALIIAPPILIMGTVTAVILGFIAEKYCETSKWIASQKGNG